MAASRFASLACVLLLGIAVSGAEAGRKKVDSVAEFASKKKELSTVLKLVVDAGLAGALGEDFEGTVFLPTNKAFKKIKDVVKTLTPEQVKTVLLYHVAPKYVRSAFFEKEKEVETLLGQKVALSTKGDKQLVNESKILSTLRLKDNKVKIFVISDVLIPQL